MLPAAVRQKLGWLLLDYLRVCSIGARLPWGGWARAYVKSVGAAGASHALFSSDTFNPQHATFLNVAFGSSFDGDDTHVGAMLHPGVAVWSAALAVAQALVEGDDGGAFGTRLSPDPRVDASYLAAIGAPFDWDQCVRRVNARSMESGV